VKALVKTALPREGCLHDASKCQPDAIGLMVVLPELPRDGGA